MGWIKDSCFIYSLLPHDYTDKQLQTEFDLSKYESLEEADDNTLKKGDDQISFLDELEKLIIRRDH